jgi:hypothetical protein
LGGFYYLEGIAMTQDEIQTAILQVCKVSGNDSDFNVLGFYVLCDRLVELGAAAEREACAKVCDSLNEDFDHLHVEACAEAIRARGQHGRS